MSCEGVDCGCATAVTSLEWANASKWHANEALYHANKALVHAKIGVILSAISGCFSIIAIVMLVITQLSR